MMNFKTLSLIGAMLVSTIGVGVAQTLNPLTFKICCPKNVNLTPGNCSPNTKCLLTCTSLSCHQPNHGENGKWNVEFKNSVPSSVSLGQPTAHIVPLANPITLQCIYNNSSTTLVYAPPALQEYNYSQYSSNDCIGFEGNP